MTFFTDWRLRLVNINCYPEVPKLQFKKIWLIYAKVWIISAPKHCISLIPLGFQLLTILTAAGKKEFLNAGCYNAIENTWKGQNRRRRTKKIECERRDTPFALYLFW